MKKIFLIFAVIAILGSLAGCGVKSALESPGDGYPRNYPVY